MSEKLISADYLFAKIDKWVLDCDGISFEELKKTLNNALAVDAVEVVRKEAVDYGYLADWYIRSVTNDPPVWTEEHIDELFNDFYLIPKDERREENAVD